MTSPVDDAPVAVEEGILAARLTTLGVGGALRYLARCADRQELTATLDWARRHRLRTLVLGGGSNLLVSDAGFDGLAVTLEDDALAIARRPGGAAISVAAGAVWDRVVERCIDAGLSGLECLSGIPGRAGAAPIQNIGAYGQELCETLTQLEVVDRRQGALRCLAASRCGFGYRTSHFKGRWKGRFVVVGLDLSLAASPGTTLRHGELKQRLASTGGGLPTPAEVRREVLAVRAGKSMLWRADDPNRRSAGSFFLNPVLSVAEARRVRRQIGTGDEEMPAFELPDGRVKIPAAWLIERAGFRRGYRLGRAALSSRHALAVVNLGGATAAELVRLAKRVRRAVRQLCGVTLQPEPELVGFDRPADELLG